VGLKNRILAWRPVRAFLVSHCMEGN
jgi:hypothetical protein